MKTTMMTAICLSLVLAGSNAEVLFQDTFEDATSVSSSDFPNSDGDCDPDSPQYGISWTIDEGSIADLGQVTDYGTPGPVPLGGGNNYWRSCYKQAGPNYAEARGGFSASSTNNLYVTAWFYAGNSGAQNGRIFLRNGDNTKYSLFLVLGEAGLGGAGKIAARNAPGTGGFVAFPGTYSGNAWHRLDIGINVADEGFGVWLDGNLFGVGYNYHSGVLTNAYVGTSPSFDASGTNRCFFDNIRVEEPPAPPALTLFQDDFEGAPFVSPSAFPNSDGDCFPLAPYAGMYWQQVESGTGITNTQVTSHGTPGPPTGGGSNYLRVSRPQNASNYVRGYFTQTSSDNLDATVWFYAESPAIWGGRVTMRTDNNDDAGTKTTVFVVLGENISGGGAGRIEVKSAPGGGWKSLGTYAASQWHRLDIAVDVADESYDVSLDGTLLGTGYNYHDDVFQSAEIQLQSSGPDGISSHFDNVSVVTQPKGTLILVK